MEDKKEKGSTPLANTRKEAFCRYYSNHFWGDPCGAIHAAGFQLEGQKAVDFAEELFDDSTIRNRITFLRRKRAEVLAADQTWIRELLVDIASNVVRDSDRIRALATLAKIIAAPGKTEKKQNAIPSAWQPCLPAFEGADDGYVEDYDESSG